MNFIMHQSIKLDQATPKLLFSQASPYLKHSLQDTNEQASENN